MQQKVGKVLIDLDRVREYPRNKRCESPRKFGLVAKPPFIMYGSWMIEVEFEENKKRVSRRVEILKYNSILYIQFRSVGYSGTRLWNFRLSQVPIKEM